MAIRVSLYYKAHRSLRHLGDLPSGQALLLLSSPLTGDSHTMWTHNSGLSSTPGGRHALSCLFAFFYRQLLRAKFTNKVVEPFVEGGFHVGSRTPTPESRLAVDPLENCNAKRLLNPVIRPPPCRSHPRPRNDPIDQTPVPGS